MKSSEQKNLYIQTIKETFLEPENKNNINLHHVIFKYF